MNLSCITVKVVHSGQYLRVLICHTLLASVSVSRVPLLGFDGLSNERVRDATLFTIRLELISTNLLTSLLVCCRYRLCWLNGIVLKHHGANTFFVLAANLGPELVASVDKLELY